MIFNAEKQRLAQVDSILDERAALLSFLRRLREEVSALRQQYPATFDNSVLMKDIEEYHSLSLVYARLARRDLLSYPIRIIKSESPDFIMEEAGHRYGLEATKATPEAYQRWMKQAPSDDESFLLHRAASHASGPVAATARTASRLIQASIHRKAVLLPAYRSNARTAHQRLIVRLQYENVAETEALLKVLWREGMIEGVAGFEQVIVVASSHEFILLDPKTGGMRRL